MSGALRTALVVLAILPYPSRAAGQPSPPEQPTALIAGQVVDAGSGRPVSGAFAVLSGGPPARVSLPPRPRPRFLTDSEGRFAFAGLAAGTYSLSVSKPGYVDGAYGRRRPEGTTQPLKIAAGERVNDLAIPVWRQASVSGTVVDEAGEPVVGVEVRALRRTLEWGRRQFRSAVSGGFAQLLTDDRGAYRIPGLTPGDYAIVVVSTVSSVPASALEVYRDAVQSGGNGSDQFTPLYEAGSSGALPGTANAMTSRDSVLSLQRMITPRPAGERVFIYPTTYYPAASSAAEGTIVKLGSGEERTAIDFQLHPAATVRVGGIATAADGPAAGVVVTLSVTVGLADTETVAATLTDGKGAFAFPAVPAGPYTLRVLKQPADPARNTTTTVIQTGSGMAIGTSIGSSGRSELSTTPVLWATVPLSVGRTDISNLAVMLQNGPRASGRIEFEGTAERSSLTLLNIGLEGETPRPSTVALSIRPASPWEIRVQDSGEFSSASVPGGRYFIRLLSPTPGWSFKSATLNGRDVTERPFDMQSDTAGIVVTLTDTPIELNGVARTAAGAPDADARVLVFPADAQTWSIPAPGMRSFRAARADKDGVFKIVGLPPGNYCAVAVAEPTAPSAAEWIDPTYLEALVRLATDVRLDDRDKRTIDLTTKEVRR